MKLNVTVKPHSTKGPLVEIQTDGSLVVYIRAIAAEGQANQALIELLSEHFKVSKSNIIIRRGHTLRYKIVEVNL